LLNRGSMFVFSTLQFSQLIDFETNFNGVKMNNLLDLGAGDGIVTGKMSPFFHKIYATEMSVTMQWRLKHKNFRYLKLKKLSI
jgi:16S rRNA A1518/A1519 N6-dimethyltransferase RsmA/KsgA/DIM1 with predicted DNA glycosylase/AP lyase activity